MTVVALIFRQNVNAHQPPLDKKSSSEAGDRLQDINSLQKLNALSGGWVLCLDGVGKSQPKNSRIPKPPPSVRFLFQASEQRLR